MSRLVAGYDAAQVLNNVQLQVRDGEAVALAVTASTMPALLGKPNLRAVVLSDVTQARQRRDRAHPTR